MPDLYQVLGVDRRADQKAIKHAYYALAHRLHPDTRAKGDHDADAQFAAVAEAYAILGDETLRRRYDRLGPWAKTMGPGSQAFQQMVLDPERLRRNVEMALAQVEDQLAAYQAKANKRPSPDHAGTVAFAFNTVMGLARSSSERAIGSDGGGAKAACAACQGSGAAPGSPVRTCHGCAGSKVVRWHKAFIKLQRPCQICLGRGTRPQMRCVVCSGRG